MRQKKPMKKNETRSEVNTIPTFGQSILGGILQGFTFGSGSAIAHNIFRPFPEEKKRECKEILQIYETLCKDNINLSFEDKTHCKEIFNEIKKSC